MKTIYFIFALFLLSNPIFAHNCSDENQDWECSTKVQNKSGTMDTSKCKNSSVGFIACYEDIVETCIEFNSNKTKTKKYTSFTGQCTKSYGDCW